MATEKTTEILEFKVEQGSAIAELERTKKSIIGLKEEQKSLNDAYKKGHITQEELAKELVRVEALLKKQGNEYNTLQKKVTGVQTETSKLTQALKDSAAQFKIAGVSVGDLGSKLSAIANPVTAAVGVVTLLSAAYARSTIGAKDLAFAQAQLSNSITQVTNDFARLISSSEDGEGAVSKLSDKAIRYVPETLARLLPGGTIFSDRVGKYFRDVADSSKAAALAAEKFEDLQREELQIRGEVSERLADNQELLTEISDEQTSINKKQEDYSIIIGNLRMNQSELVGILEKQRDEIQKQLEIDTENEQLQTLLLQKNKEIEKVKSDTEKRIQGMLRGEENLLEANRKQLQLEREKTSELERQQRIAQFERNQRGNKSEMEKLIEDSQVRIELDSKEGEAFSKTQRKLADDIADANKKIKASNDAISESTMARQDALRLFSSESARLFQTINVESKGFAAAQLILDSALTLSGITKNAATLGPVAGPIYYAAAIASAGANLSRAAQLLGLSSPLEGAAVSTFTASDGQQYAVGKNGEVIPIEDGDTSNIVTNKRGQTFDVNERSTRGLLYRLAHPFRGLRKLFKRNYDAGGWTGPGDTYDVAGVVHADEYVVPKKINNNPAAKPHIQALEQMRTRGYANGGYVKPMDVDSNLINALSNLQIYASITDINNAYKRQAVKMNLVNR